MSNVLIGIIGVILFIGLALAGALFLGPRFQQSVAQSKAAAVVQTLDQVAKAVAMRNVQTGEMQGASDSLIATVVSEGYLKVIPVNPIDASRIVNVGDEAGSLNGQPVKWIYTWIGTDETAKSTCLAIERNAGSDLREHIDTPTKFNEWVPGHRRVGCLNNFYGGSYTAYVPV